MENKRRVLNQVRERTCVKIIGNRRVSQGRYRNVAPTRPILEAEK